MKPILIVEDNELNLELMETILRSNGFAFESASTGEMSIQLCTEKEFSLVLMDLQLPDISGFQVLARVREVRSRQALPAIAITGNTTLSDQKKVQDAGFDGFLKKPFRIGDLMNIVKEHITP